MDVDALDRVLKDRGVEISRSKLSAALQDPAFSSWAKLHLTPATLLTPDELASFTAISDAGTLKTLGGAAAGSGPLPLPRSQPDLEVAVRELGRSAAAISKQTETLRQQQEALARFARARISDEGRRSELDAARMHRKAVETREVKNAVEDLSRSLEVKLSESEQQSQAIDGDLRKCVEEVLSSDDKLLASLEKLSGEFNLVDRRDDDVVDGLRQTCMRLIKCTVELTRCRLDRTYLEALETAVISAPKHLDTTPPEDVAALREEVDSLYAEIFPVVQMSVENQYLQPAVRKVTTRNAQALEHSSAAVDYIIECLDHLQSKATALLSHIENLHSHRAATETIAAASRAELSQPITKRRRSDTHPSRSPTHPRRHGSNPRSDSPVRTRPTSLIRRRRSSFSSDEPALSALLRTLSLTALPDDPGELVAALEDAVAEREAKVRDVAADAQVSFVEAAGAQLYDVQRAVGILRGCVLADSRYGAVKLVDEEVEASIRVTEEEVDAVRARVKAVESSGGPARSVKREELVRRWGRLGE